VPSPEHDEVVALLRAMAAERPDGTEAVEDARIRLDGLGDLFPVPPGVAVAPTEVAGVAAERYVPAARQADGLVLYLHGGSYVAGSLQSHRPLCARLAEAVGVPVVALAYRLAPEHPHPAGLDDALAAYTALRAEADAGRIVVVGDSAGGGLATALALALAGRHEPLPAGVVLVSAWLDLTLSGASIRGAAGADPMLDAPTLRRHAEAYAGGRLRDPLVSPVFATPATLAGLPPFLLLAGTADILVDDSRTFASRARAAGAAVDLDVGDGLVHVWPFLDGVPEAADALTRIATWARARLTA
jgi:acetyl esterase/lipase